MIYNEKNSGYRKDGQGISLPLSKLGNFVASPHILPGGNSDYENIKSHKFASQKSRYQRAS
jgi:hypothetical protein